MSGTGSACEGPEEVPGPRHRLRETWRWGLTGVLLIGLHLALFLVSPRFAYGGELLKRPILVLVAAEVFAGALYLLAARGASKESRSRAVLIWVLLVGAGLRLCMLTSTPMLEDDYYRYLWDGGVVANGFNPYTYSPTEVATGVVPESLQQLAEDSGVVAERVNHPRLRTIYPPVAQAAFALAHLLAPWSLVGWRVVLLMLDAATLCLLMLVLRHLKLPILGVVIYWWNPLVVKEVLNSGHMEVVVLPFVLGGVLLAMRGRHGWAAGLVGLAVGAKIWPIILLPIIMRPVLREPKRLLAGLLMFIVPVGVAFVPIYAAGFDFSSGLVAYGQRWEMNDALFMVFVRAAQLLLKLIGKSPEMGQLVARISVAAVLAGVIALTARRRIKDGFDLWKRCLLIVAAMFLLSPTQFPWYYLWVLPFLVACRKTSLLLLTALLPVYYLRFYLRARGMVDVFDYGVVWVEFAPVWCLLVYEWYRGRRRRAVLARAGGM